MVFAMALVRESRTLPKQRGQVSIMQSTRLEMRRIHGAEKINIGLNYFVGVVNHFLSFNTAADNSLLHKETKATPLPIPFVATMVQDQAAVAFW